METILLSVASQAKLSKHRNSLEMAPYCGPNYAPQCLGGRVNKTTVPMLVLGCLSSMADANWYQLAPSNPVIKLPGIAMICPAGNPRLPSPTVPSGCLTSYFHNYIQDEYLLVMSTVCYRKWPSRNDVSFPIQSGGSFHGKR